MDAGFPINAFQTTLTSDTGKESGRETRNKMEGKTRVLLLGTY